MIGRQNADLSHPVDVPNYSVTVRNGESSNKRSWSLVVANLMQTISRTCMWTPVSGKSGIDNKDGDVPEYTNEHLERALLELKSKEKLLALSQLKARRKCKADSKSIFEVMRQDVCARTSTVISLDHEMITDITYPVVIRISEVGVQQKCQSIDENIDIKPDVNNTSTQSSADIVRLGTQTETDDLPHPLEAGTDSSPDVSEKSSAEKELDSSRNAETKSKIKSKVPVLKSNHDGSSSSSVYAMHSQCKIMKANKKYNMSRIPQRTKLNTQTNPRKSSKTNILKASTDSSHYCMKTEQQLISVLQKNDTMKLSTLCSQKKQMDEMRRTSFVKESRSKEMSKNDLLTDARKRDDVQKRKLKLTVAASKQFEKEIQPQAKEIFLQEQEAVVQIDEEQPEIVQQEEQLVAVGQKEEEQEELDEQVEEEPPLEQNKNEEEDEIDEADRISYQSIGDCQQRQSIEILKKFSYTEPVSAVSAVTINNVAFQSYIQTVAIGNDASTMSDDLQKNAQCQSDDDDDNSDKRHLYEEQVYKHLSEGPPEPGNHESNIFEQSCKIEDGEMSQENDMVNTEVVENDDDEYEDYDEFEMDEMEQQLRLTLKNSIKQRLQRKLKNQTKMFQRQSETTMQAVEKYMNPMDFAMLKLQGQKSLLSVGISSAIVTKEDNSGMVHKRSIKNDRLGRQSTSGRSPGQPKDEEPGQVEEEQKEEVKIQIDQIVNHSQNIALSQHFDDANNGNKENEQPGTENIYICDPQHKIHEVLRQSMPYNNIILPVFVPPPSIRASLSADLKFQSLKSNEVPASIRNAQNEYQSEKETNEEQKQEHQQAEGRQSIFDNIALRPQQVIISGHPKVPFFYGQCDLRRRESE